MSRLLACTGQGFITDQTGAEIAQLPGAEAVFGVVESVYGGAGIIDDMREGRRTDTTEMAQLLVFTQAAVQVRESGLIEFGEADDGSSIAIGSETIEYTAGHSVGEVSAMFFGGIISLKEAVEIVKFRGEAMQTVFDDPNTPLTVMRALVPPKGKVLDINKIEHLCEEFSAEEGQHGLYLANYNSPSQLVLGGLDADVDNAAERLKEEQGIRSKIVKVPGAFHTPIMQPAREKLSEFMETRQLRKPSVGPLIQNFDGKEHVNPATINQNFVKQADGSVRWMQSMQHAEELGVSEVVLLGPGSEKFGRTITESAPSITVVTKAAQD